MAVNSLLFPVCLCMRLVSFDMIPLPQHSPATQKPWYRMQEPELRWGDKKPWECWSIYALYLYLHLLKGIYANQ